MNDVAISVPCALCGGTGQIPASPARHQIPPKPYEIIRFVAERYRVPHLQLSGPGRRAIIRRPRRIAMWILYVLGFTYPEIGRLFGKADHTSGHAAVKRVEAERAADPEFRRETDTLTAALLERYPPLAAEHRRRAIGLVISAQSSADA